MSDSLDVGEITALLFDERRYESDIRPKALHKILYFVKQELDREHVDDDLEIFWYMWGAMAATADSPVEFREGTTGRKVVCNMDVGDIDASQTTMQRGRRAISRVLDQYYDLGIEGLTDEMYAEAPYEVQKHYREMDKQLNSATDSEQMTPTFDRNETMIRSSLHDISRTFPVDDFPEYEDDLQIWYRLMSAELDSPDYDPDRAHSLAKVFWRLFCLELASREDGLSQEELEAEPKPDVNDIDAAKEEIRTELRRMEREKAKRNSRDSKTAIKAADAFASPFLAEDIVRHP